MAGWLERLKKGADILSQDDRHLSKEEIKEVQGRASELAFGIERSIPVPEQHKQLETVKNLSKLTPEQQEDFTKQSKNKINESKRSGVLNQDEASTLGAMIDNQAMLVSLMSCVTSKQPHEQGKFQDECSKFFQRELSSSEKNDVRNATISQISYLQSLAKERADGESQRTR